MADADVTYTIDSAGWDALACGEEIERALQGEMRLGVAHAKAISPRASDEERAYFLRRYGDVSPVHYADSFQVTTHVVSHQGRPRLEGVIRNVSPQSPAVEYGNKRMSKAFHVMAKTAEFLGSYE